MKFFFVLVFTISSGISCFTQIIQDTASFLTGLQMIDHAQTEDQYMEAAEFFDEGQHGRSAQLMKMLCVLGIDGVVGISHGF